MNYFLFFVGVLVFNSHFAKANPYVSNAEVECDGEISQLGYFYAYTYQFVYFQSGILKKEAHTFSFAGALSVLNNAREHGFFYEHALYAKGDLEVAVPFAKGAGLYLKSPIFVGPDTPSGWRKICK